MALLGIELDCLELKVEKAFIGSFVNVGTKLPIARAPNVFRTVRLGFSWKESLVRFVKAFDHQDGKNFTKGTKLNHLNKL